jgi:hypothetical protein
MQRPTDKHRLNGLSSVAPAKLRAKDDKSSYQAWQKVPSKLYSYFSKLSIWAKISGVSDWLICRIYPELPFEIDRNSSKLQLQNRVILARYLL